MLASTSDRPGHASSPVSPGNLDRLTSIILGLEYAHEGLLLGYEFQTLESRINLSFDAHRLRARYDRTVGRDLTFSVGGGAEWLNYTNAEELGLEEDEDFQTTYNAYGQMTQRINNHTLWRLRGDFRDISGRQDTMEVEVSAGLEWRYRELEFSIDGRYRHFEQERTEGDVLGLEFKLRRYF